jgi:hypothetical protein
VLAQPENRLLAALAPAALHREAVNERRRGGYLIGRGGPTEALWGEATVAPSFRSMVEREQLGRRVSAWDDECGGGIDRRTAHRWAEFGRCGTTLQCRRNRARDGDLAGVHQLVDRLRYEEGGGHGMAVVDSDEERWARTDANGCSGGAAPGSLGGPLHREARWRRRRE